MISSQEHQSQFLQARYNALNAKNTPDSLNITKSTSRRNVSSIGEEYHSSSVTETSDLSNGRLTSLLLKDLQEAKLISKIPESITRRENHVETNLDEKDKCIIHCPIYPSSSNLVKSDATHLPVHPISLPHKSSLSHLPHSIPSIHDNHLPHLVTSDSDDSSQDTEEYKSVPIDGITNEIYSFSPKMYSHTKTVISPNREGKINAILEMARNQTCVEHPHTKVGLNKSKQSFDFREKSRQLDEILAGGEGSYLRLLSLKQGTEPLSNGVKKDTGHHKVFSYFSNSHFNGKNTPLNKRISGKVPKPKRNKKHVTFKNEIISTVHHIERIHPDCKEELFYNSLELQKFRLEYLIELDQGACYEMDNETHNSNQNQFFDILTSIADIFSCKNVTT